MKKIVVGLLLVFVILISGCMTDSIVGESYKGLTVKDAQNFLAAKGIQCQTVKEPVTSPSYFILHEGEMDYLYGGQYFFEVRLDAIANGSEPKAHFTVKIPNSFLSSSLEVIIFIGLTYATIIDFLGATASVKEMVLSHRTQK